MATPSDDHTPTRRPIDEENYIDKRRKQEILNARSDVREWRQELFSSIRMGEIEEQTGMLLYGDRVREYLMAIEPLLRNESLPMAEEAYHGVYLGEVVVHPPEVEGARSELLQSTPEPKREAINGLQTVIERERIVETWEVQIRDTDSSRRREERTLQNSAPLSREILQNATRTADEWLQKIGVGLEVGHPEVDDQDDNPF